LQENNFALPVFREGFFYTEIRQIFNTRPAALAETLNA
jgi:hypothetical protein